MFPPTLPTPPPSPGPETPDDPPADPIAAALPQAIQNSYNAERLVSGDSTCDVVSETAIAAEPRDLAFRRTRNLLDDIAEAVAARPNALSAPASAIRPLEREFGRSQGAPYVIYQALLRSARRIDRMCVTEELDGTDYDISDYRQQMTSIALDVLVNDTQVKSALDARVGFHMRELTAVDAAAMRELGRGLGQISTPRLGEQMVEDAATATDPTEPDPEAKSDAGFQFGSRVVRMLNVNRRAVEDVAMASSITSFAWSIVQWFQK